MSKVEQWSQLCGPRSHPRRHFYAFEADEGRCLDVAGSGAIERGMNVQVDRCVYTRDDDGSDGNGGGYGNDRVVTGSGGDDYFDEDRAFRQNFCFLNDSTIRCVSWLGGWVVGWLTTAPPISRERIVRGRAHV